ncbi:MAG: HD domain-containing protein [Candidatus Jacksonbacteria bacterium]|nr:HD domain-containing protein [Candidatus Jacksonbacteria bacterium]
MADRFSNSTQTVRAKLGLTWGDIKVVEQSILYHDLGKIDTVKWNEKTNGYSFYGHERYSLNRMKDLNAINPIPHYDRVRWIVSNHIRIHALTKGQMKNPFKIDKLKSNPDFKLLNWFEKLDDMILNYEDWANSLKEES